MDRKEYYSDWENELDNELYNASEKEKELENEEYELIKRMKEENERSMRLGDFTIIMLIILFFLSLLSFILSLML